MSTIPQKPIITKAIWAKGSMLTVIPKPWLEQLGIDSSSYLEHSLKADGTMITRAVKLSQK